MKTYLMTTLHFVKDCRMKSARALRRLLVKIPQFTRNESKNLLSVRPILGANGEQVVLLLIRPGDPRPLLQRSNVVVVLLEETSEISISRKTRDGDICLPLLDTVNVLQQVGVLQLAPIQITKASGANLRVAQVAL